MISAATPHPACCPVCDCAQAKIFFSSSLSASIRSDWVPVPVPAQVLQCIDCGHLYKALELTRKWSDYSKYNAWNNSPTGDKLDFQGGMPVTRSSKLIDFLKQRGILDSTRTVLDYGCNRGAFLSLLSGQNHAGFDVSEQYRSIIEKLGCSYFTPQNLPLRNSFDVLTLIHVFEHLEKPFSDIQTGLQALKGDGVVLIQVPDPFTQPTDLYVIDHCSHFSSGNLAAAMFKAGHVRMEPVVSVLPGEWTGLFRPRNASDEVILPRRSSDDEYRRLESALIAGEEMLLELQRSHKPCMIYGAGLLGSMIADVLKGQVTGFLDDNGPSQGGTLSGIPIRSLESIGHEKKSIVLAVPPMASHRVAEKSRAGGHEVYVPYARVT